MRKFVVTGCGRSGTGYAAALFQHMGIRCGHEQLLNKRTTVPVSFDGVDGDSSWMAVPYLAHLPADTVVLHQVRHPLDVIRSWVDTGVLADRMIERSLPMHLAKRALRRAPSGDYGTRIFLKRECPVVFTHRTPVTRAARYWVEWNVRAEAAASLPNLVYRRYRLEELDESLGGELLDLLDVSHDRLREAFAAVSRSTNTKPRRTSMEPADLAEVLADVEQLAASYDIEM